MCLTHTMRAERSMQFVSIPDNGLVTYFHFSHKTSWHRDFGRYNFYDIYSNFNLVFIAFQSLGVDVRLLNKLIAVTSPDRCKSNRDNLLGRIRILIGRIGIRHFKSINVIIAVINCSTFDLQLQRLTVSNQKCPLRQRESK